MSRKCLLEPQSKLQESPFRICLHLQKHKQQPYTAWRSTAGPPPHGNGVAVHIKGWAPLSQHDCVQKQPPHGTFLTARNNAPKLGFCKANYLNPYCSLSVVLNELQAAHRFHLPMEDAAKVHLQSVPSNSDHGHHLCVSHIPLWWPRTTLHTVHKHFPSEKHQQGC